MTTTRIIVCVGVLLELQLQRISLSNDTENLDGDHGPFVSDTNYTPLINSSSYQFDIFLPAVFDV